MDIDLARLQNVTGRQGFSCSLRVKSARSRVARSGVDFGRRVRRICRLSCGPIALAHRWGLDRVLAVNVRSAGSSPRTPDRVRKLAGVRTIVAVHAFRLSLGSTGSCVPHNLSDTIPSRAPRPDGVEAVGCWCTAVASGLETTVGSESLSHATAWQQRLPGCRPYHRRERWLVPCIASAEMLGLSGCPPGSPGIFFLK